MAKSRVILVVGFAAGLEGRAQHFDSPAVFTPEVVKRRDVVVSLPQQGMHGASESELAGFQIGRKGAREVVQTYQAHRNIVGGNRERFRLLLRVRTEITMRSLIVFESFGEPILAMKYVAGVQIHSRDSPLVALGGKDLTHFACGRERTVVLSRQYQWLDGGIQGSCKFFRVAESGKDFPRPFVISNRGSVL